MIMRIKQSFQHNCMNVLFRILLLLLYKKCFFQIFHFSVFVPLLMALASYCGISRIGNPLKANNIKDAPISSPTLCPFQEAVGCMKVSEPKYTNPKIETA